MIIKVGAFRCNIDAVLSYEIMLQNFKFIKQGKRGRNRKEEMRVREREREIKVYNANH